jgi:hypothetical protein
MILEKVVILAQLKDAINSYLVIKRDHFPALNLNVNKTTLKNIKSCP